VDRTGGYGSALALHAALLVLSAVLLLRFERFPDCKAARPAAAPAATATAG
jgi:hypothetical protein